MNDLTREQSQSVVEGELKEPFPLNGTHAPNRRRRTAARLSVTLLIVVFGLGAGWLAGRVLNRARGGSGSAVDTGAPQVESSASTSAAQTHSRSPANVNSPDANAAAANSAAWAVNPAPIAKPEPAPGPPVLQEVPASQPRADDNDGSAGELPAEEQSARDISRKAMRKILKETEKATRSGNDNDNRSAERKTNENTSVHDKQNINENKNQNPQK
jgi:hypothetical protein